MREPEDRLTRQDAERLLDTPAEHDSALGRALAAAGGPARPGELRREDAAVAAYHQARLSPPPAARTGFVSPRRLGRRAATHAVVATAAVVALASGSFALAGSIGLPVDLPGRASERASESVAQDPSSTGGGGATTDTSTTSTSGGSTTSDPASSSGGPGSTTGSSTTTASPTAGTSPTSGTPSPDLRGLCRAYQATDRSAAGSSLDSAAFAALVTAAGGADLVPAFCVALIGEPPVKPTKPAKPEPTKPGKPEPTKPEPTKPEPTKPEPTKPEPTTPEPGKPEPTKPEPTKPGSEGNPHDNDNSGNGSSGNNGTKHD